MSGKISEEPPFKKVKLEKLDENSTVLHWFRTDLRLNDNTALSMASLKSQGRLACLWVNSPDEWKNHDVAPIKVDFMYRNVAILKEKLKDLGIPLIVKTAPDKSQVASIVTEVATKISAKLVTYNIEYEVDEGKRDQKVKESLEKLGIQVLACHDQCVIPPGTCLTKEGKIYTVYTPFKNTWFRMVSEQRDKYLTLSPLPAKQSSLEFPSDPIPTEMPAQFTLPENIQAIRELWPAGEQEAQNRMQRWINRFLSNYSEDRNFPYKKDSSSSLSPYLASGILSARQCVVAAVNANNGRLDSGGQGPVVWIQELIWRDFYRHVLFGFPRVCKNKAFKVDTDRLEWSWDKQKFDKWCQGKTGFPIVDAGMRQLLATGWMHNRLRMIVAMFLTKDLMIDWRWGERWFMQHLIDGDFASNNGGWQWSASTGTDAQPYFRVFNPVNQSEKSDPKGEYIKKYVSELCSLSAPAIHAPKKEVAQRLGYPEPMVKHDEARVKVIAAFKALSNREDVEPKLEKVKKEKKENIKKE